MLRDEGDVEGWGRHHVMGKPCGAGMASDGGDAMWHSDGPRSPLLTLSPSLSLPACAFRYNGLSFVYLIYLLLIPLFSEPTKATMQGKRLVLL